MKKKMLMAIAYLLLVSSWGIAQQKVTGTTPKHSPEEQAKMRVERLDKLLTLNQTQKDSIYNLVLAHAQQRTTLKNEGGNRKANIEKFRQQREAQTAKIKSWLSPEQARLFEEQQEKMKSRMPKHTENQ
ncbi:hypothetical protein HX021_17355 [Sphingobacterium sp. N143]|uniref:hypothetical protein n=1 Tax=Sphingobacterium sp. N143 TaxID=2746727 RepID=UPI0025774D8E|nr:hypothetical protein [Sphingobacterium sp. N143]MDM1296059.1 hypothetical protein [Sphingobacterium sp. N143]